MLMVRMTAKPNVSFGSTLKPKVTVIQFGTELGWFGGEFVHENGGLGAFPGDGFRWDNGLFFEYGLFGATADELVPMVRFNSDLPFTLRVRDTEAWPASASSVDYEIPGKGGAGNMLVSGKQSGVWWNPAEPGWGLAFDRNERGVMFAAWFSYDKQGRATWYVMPNGQATGLNSVEGDVYRPQGPAFSQPKFDSALVNVGAPVGRFRFQWQDDANGIFSFDVEGVSAVKPITRFVQKDATGEVCKETRGVFWRPEESGWGLALEGTFVPWCPMFAAWYTYDADNHPIWFVMPSGQTSHPLSPGFGVSTGSVYRPAGPALAAVFDASQVRIGAPLGTFEFRSLSSGRLEFSYRIGAVSAAKAVDRFKFEY